MKIGKTKITGLKSIKVVAGDDDVKIKLSKKTVRQIKAALKKAGKKKATLVITPTSGAGKGKPKKVTIRLK